MPQHRGGVLQYRGGLPEVGRQRGENTQHQHRRRESKARDAALVWTQSCVLAIADAAFRYCGGDLRHFAKLYNSYFCKNKGSIMTINFDIMCMCMAAVS